MVMLALARNFAHAPARWVAMASSVRPLSCSRSSSSSASGGSCATTVWNQLGVGLYEGQCADGPAAGAEDRRRADVEMGQEPAPEGRAVGQAGRAAR